MIKPGTVEAVREVTNLYIFILNKRELFSIITGLIIKKESPKTI